MKVLLLNGSPHPNGCTFRALSEVEKTLQQEGIETEIFHIGTEAIRGCMGCGMCRKNKLGRCIFGEDAVNVVIKKMEECDGLIVGSPVHYAGASGGITSFLDRMFYSTGGFAEYIRDMGFIPEQAQDFYPTPSTLSTCMYYTGLDPRTMDPVYVPKSPHEKAMQRALIQYRNPENYELVCEALRRTHREDLIGFGPKCLVRPRKMAGEAGKPSRGKGSNGKGFGQKTANDRSGQGKAKTGGRPKKTLRNVHKKK